MADVLIRMSYDTIVGGYTVVPAPEEWSMVSVEQVVPGLYSIRLDAVNAFLIDADELTLIDTGSKNSADTVVAAVHAIGRTIGDLRHILVTHCQPDHAGSLAALQQRIGAATYMHPLDAAITV